MTWPHVPHTLHSLWGWGPDTCSYLVAKGTQPCDRHQACGEGALGPEDVHWDSSCGTVNTLGGRKGLGTETAHLLCVRPTWVLYLAHCPHASALLGAVPESRVRVSLDTEQHGHN